MADFRTAAFRTESFSLAVGSDPCPFPVLTAQMWLEIFCSPSWLTATFGEIPVAEREAFLDKVESGRMEAGDVRTLVHAALSQSAGRPWWEAERLIGACFADNGRLLGTVLMSGVDPSRMTLAVFLACVWATLSKGADATQLVKLESELLVPPPEATPEERGELDDDVSGMVDRLRGMPGVRTG